jgi:large subunit ribosomal protein L7e
MSGKAVAAGSAKPKAAAKAAPESVLLRRKNTARLRAERAKQVTAARQQRAKSRVLAFKRAEQYAKEYRDREKSLVNLRRQARQAGSFFLEPEPKLAFVIRIRGLVGVSPRVRKILQLLRLRQSHNGVFIKLTYATWQMLRIVEPYIAYGYPTLASVRQLLYKRGFAKINHQRKPIIDNAMIEEKLGSRGIICVEDLVHEIYTVGPNFKYASRFLWPFKLNSPTGGFKDIGRQFTDNGSCGNWEQHINKLIKQMN